MKMKRLVVVDTVPTEKVLPLWVPSKWETPGLEGKSLMQSPPGGQAEKQKKET